MNENLAKRLKRGIETARGIDGDFVYITIGDAKRILKLLEVEVDDKKAGDSGRLQADRDGNRNT